MAEIASAESGLLPALQVAQEAQVLQAPNGVCYASYGENRLTGEEIERVVQAVPQAVAHGLGKRAYYFVPLTIGENDETVIAPAYTIELGDRAICHRNFKFGGADCVFISTRLMQDRFALAFEYFINVGHHFVESVGVPETFNELLWSQAKAEVRGETSQDAWESRRRALDSAREVRNGHGGPTLHQEDERAKNSYFESAFSDALAIYMLSLTVDFDYLDLREREYPLLAPPALAERLRHVAALFPPNAGYEFEIKYRRRS